MFTEKVFDLVFSKWIQSEDVFLSNCWNIQRIRIKKKPRLNQQVVMIYRVMHCLQWYRYGDKVQHYLLFKQYHSSRTQTTKFMNHPTGKKYLDDVNGITLTDISNVHNQITTVGGDGYTIPYNIPIFAPTIIHPQMDTLDESLFNVFCFGYQYKVNSVSKLNKILKVRKFYLDGQFLHCIIFHHIVIEPIH